MRLTRLTPLALGVGLVLGSAWALWRALGSDPGSPELLTHLRTLGGLEADLGRSVLEARFGLVWSYDVLVRTSGAVIDRIEQIEEDVRGHPVLAREEDVLAEWQRARDALEDETRMVERFKSQHSILRNSLRFLPRASADAARALRESGREALARDAENLLTGTLVRIMETDAGSTDGLAQAQARLGSEASRGTPAAGPTRILLRHAGKLLEIGPEISRLVREIESHEADQRLANVSGMVESLYAREVARGEQERTALYGLAVLLMALAALGTARIWFQSRRLRHMNETLEERVREGSSQLAHAQKLEAVGRLAAGIAHEINTPAQFVGDNLRFLDESTGELITLAEGIQKALSAADRDPADVLREVAELVSGVDLEFVVEEVPQAFTQSIDGMDRVSSIVRAMKEFAHPGSEERAEIDLNRAIESTLTVSRNAWKTIAEVHTELDPDLPDVPVHRNEFNQAVLNIIVNAAQAIQETGEQGRIEVSTQRDDDSVEVRISDNGPGMPEEVRARVFDPFFTTKGVGQGTGQGLAIARSAIVDKHGGSIDVESEPGRGTTFRIRLPLAVDQEAA